MPHKDKAEYNAYMRRYRRKKKAELERAQASVIQDGEGRDPVQWDKFAEWCERKLKVSTSPLTGKPFIIPTWQDSWIKGAWGPGIRESGLCVARKNGKSGLIASMLLFLMSSISGRNGRMFSISIRGMDPCSRNSETGQNPEMSTGRNTRQTLTARGKSRASTETVPAPAGQGAIRVHTGSMCPNRNAVRRDAGTVECRDDFCHGLLTAT